MSWTKIDDNELEERGERGDRRKLRRKGGGECLVYWETLFSPLQQCLKVS